MKSNNAYVTELATENTEENFLNYVEKLNTKIDYAKWKQNLLLTYNYMPLETVKESLEKETKVYEIKKAEGEKKVIIETSSERVENEVKFVRELANKLIEQTKEIENQIELIRLKNKVLEANALAKRESMKKIIKENVYLSKVLIDQKNELSKIKIPLTAQSARKTSRTFKSESKKTVSTFKEPSQYQAISANNVTNELYRECLQSIVKEIRKMNKSSDVQTGIYFEVMKKKMNIKSASYSVKSKICDVLMDRYSDLRIVRPKEEDFVMGLETFMGLNWKQIMGIVLVKDRNGEKLEGFLKSL